MEVATCQHKERIYAAEGLEIGTCDTCHQVTRYEQYGSERILVVTKLGRIDGRVVLPNPKARLLLSKEDKQDLEGRDSSGHFVKGNVPWNKKPTLFISLQAARLLTAATAPSEYGLTLEGSQPRILKHAHPWAKLSARR